MLLPSALSCDAAHPSRSLFTSPPLSPAPIPATPNTLNNIYSACRNLQSMLSPPASNASSVSPESARLASPLMFPMPTPSTFKLRLRNHNNEHRSARSGFAGGSASMSTNMDMIASANIRTPRMKITKRTAPPRGLNKRRRSPQSSSMGRDDELDSDDELASTSDKEPSNTNYTTTTTSSSRPAGREHDDLPRTPKRLRLAPEIIPRGLQRDDFTKLHEQASINNNPSRPWASRPSLITPDTSFSETRPLQPGFAFTFTAQDPPYPSFSSTSSSQSSQPPPCTFNPAPALSSSIPIPAEEQAANDNHDDEEEEWTTEEDRLLVSLVLEKLKLSKSDWVDCARSLGKDRGNLGRRWQSLVSSGDIGLKNRHPRRERLYGSWR